MQPWTIFLLIYVGSNWRSDRQISEKKKRWVLKQEPVQRRMVFLGECCISAGQTGTELFCYLTFLHTNTFILLTIFSLGESISLKIWERSLSWHAKCSLPVSIRGSKTSHATSLMSEVMMYGRKFSSARLKLLNRLSMIHHLSGSESKTRTFLSHGICLCTPG